MEGIWQSHCLVPFQKRSMDGRFWMLTSFCPERTETDPAPGSAGIFNGNQPLKWKESGNRIV
jgi:hypothetical protein